MPAQAHYFDALLGIVDHRSLTPHRAALELDGALCSLGIPGPVRPVTAMPATGRR